MTQVIEVSPTIVRLAQDRIQELRAQGLPVTPALRKVAQAPLFDHVHPAALTPAPSSR